MLHDRLPSCRRLKRRHLLALLGALALLAAARSLLMPTTDDRPTSAPPPPPDYDDFSNETTERELVLLQMVFRHGHRAPFNLYPNDKHSVDFWKEGLGQLTQLGRLQHFVVGAHLHDRYRDFITGSPRELELLTADSHRCQFGAYAFAAGLYPPVEPFTEELAWQPIVARHYPDGDNKWVLSRRKCAVAGAEESEYKESEEARRVRQHYQPLYDFWTEHSGRHIKDWTRAADLGKTLACERDYNLSVPAWASKHWKELEVQAGLSYYWNFRTRLIQRFRAGPLLGYMMSKVRQKLDGTLPEKKTLVYSAHGSNLACMLMALGQYNFRAPPHAAALVLELWREVGSGAPALRWLYFNASNPERRMDEPVALRPTGCPAPFCPVVAFEEAVRDLMPGDWPRECLDFSLRGRYPAPNDSFLPSGAGQKSFHLLLCVLSLVATHF